MKLHNLQILRGIAALLVVFFHFKEYLNFTNLKLGDLLFQKGSIGVPVFFVISGFIMVYTTSKTNSENTLQNVITFFKKRIVRIIPLYYFLTILWIIFCGGTAIYFSENSCRLLYSLLFLPYREAPPVLFLGWSLNFEMFFYFIFALSLFFKKYRYHFLIVFFSCTILIGFIWNFTHPFLKLATSQLNTYFTIGVILGLFFDKISLKKQTALIISIIGILFFLVGYFEIFEIKVYVLKIIWVSALVISFLLMDKFQIQSSKFFIHLGNISYSMYLFHPFVEIFMRKLKIMFGATYQIHIFVLGIVLVIVFSSILYEIFEKRFTNMLKRKWIKN